MLKVLTIATVAGGMLAGCATPTPRAMNTPDAAPTAQAASLHCLKTGSRIVQKDNECANVSGRAYSRDDIDRTGAFTVSEALRRLDPSVN